MAKLTWDAAGTHIFETGVKECVLYVYDSTASSTNYYGTGVAWNGITGITESPSGAEANPQYADDIKYLNLISAEEFGATVEAFMYPDAFAACDGSASIATGVSIGQQARKKFCLCYKTTVGNDVDDNAGYKLHIIYGAMAAPSEAAYQSESDSPEPNTFSWELSTTPIEPGTINGVTYTATSCVILDSTKFASNQYWDELLDYLQGGATVSAQVLTPAEIYKVLTTGSKS